MELSQRHHPSLWTALIWKDFQQVKQTFIAVLAGVFCVQLALLVAGACSRDVATRAALFGGTVTFACIAPILLALGCSGMLVGQERQSGTWAWSSSLPVTWFQALSSKLLVSIFGSIVASLPLVVIPIGLLITRLLDTGASSVAAIHVSWLTFVIFLEVVVFCFLTTVLIRETLTALVVAGIGLAVVQIFAGAAIMEPSLLGGVNSVAPYQFSIFVSAMLVTGFLLMTAAFRWRWGIGQQATFNYVRNSSPISPAIKSNYQFAIGNAPSEWRMMLRHSLANSFWLRLMVLIGVFAFSSSNFGPNELCFPILLTAVGIFGITAFEGDQTLNRFRFLADRGVVPWKLVVCRLLVVAVLALVASVVFALRVGRQQPGTPTLLEAAVWLGPVVFMIGVFSSMCFRKSIIAMTLAFVVLVVSFTMTASIIQWIHSQAEWVVEGQSPLGNVILYFSPVAVFAILVATLILSRRWLVFDDAKLAPHFLWISAVALFSPVLLACSLGFLLVPNVPWQEITAESQLRGRRVRTEVLGFSHPLLNDYIDVDYRSLLGDVYGELIQLRKSPEHGVMELIEPLLTPLEDELKSGQKPIGVELQYSHYAKSLEFMIARTAALAKVCLDEKEPQSALRFWRANRELQKLSYEFDPALMKASRIAAMQLLSELNDDEVTAMGGVEVFKSLIPSAFDERAASIRQSWLVANSHRNYLRNSIVGLFPPLLWRIERQLALSVEMYRRDLKTQPQDFLTHQSRATLINRYPD